MIQIYMREGCPFCKKVEKAAREMGLTEDKDFQLIDASPFTPGRDVVMKLGGKAMVPFMVDGEVSMYESDDIIAYLQART